MSCVIEIKEDSFQLPQPLDPQQPDVPQKDETLAQTVEEIEKLAARIKRTTPENPGAPMSLRFDSPVASKEVVGLLEEDLVEEDLVRKNVRAHWNYYGTPDFYYLIAGIRLKKPGSVIVSYVPVEGQYTVQTLSHKDLRTRLKKPWLDTEKRMITDIKVMIASTQKDLGEAELHHLKPLFGTKSEEKDDYGTVQTLGTLPRAQSWLVLPPLPDGFEYGPNLSYSVEVLNCYPASNTIKRWLGVTVTETDDHHQKRKDECTRNLKDAVAQLKRKREAALE